MKKTSNSLRTPVRISDYLISYQSSKIKNNKLLTATEQSLLDLNRYAQLLSSCRMRKRGLKLGDSDRMPIRYYVALLYHCLLLVQGSYSGCPSHDHQFSIDSAVFIFSSRQLYNTCSRLLYTIYPFVYCKTSND